MSAEENKAIPEVFREDIGRAVEILKAGGCSEVYVFGSGVTGKVRDGSDLDLAIRGCPKGSFFKLLGKLFWDLNHPVDLVDLDTEDAFAQYLQEEEVLVRVG